MTDRVSTGQEDGRRARGKRREQAMVDAARRLFISRGYRGTTLEAIIAEVGGSRETIYRAFGGKRGLLSAVITRVGDPIVATVGGEQDASVRDTLHGFALDLMTFWMSEEGRAMNRMVLAEGMDASEILETWYDSAVRPSLDALSHYLEAQQARGLFASADVPGAARQFLLLLMAEAAFASIVPGDGLRSAEALVDRTLDLFLGKQDVGAHTEPR